MPQHRCLLRCKAELLRLMQRHRQIGSSGSASSTKATGIVTADAASEEVESQVQLRCSCARQHHSTACDLVWSQPKVRHATQQFQGPAPPERLAAGADGGVARDAVRRDAGLVHLAQSVESGSPLSPSLAGAHHRAEGDNSGPKPRGKHALEHGCRELPLGAPLTGADCRTERNHIRPLRQPLAIRVAEKDPQCLLPAPRLATGRDYSTIGHLVRFDITVRHLEEQSSRSLVLPAPIQNADQVAICNHIGWQRHSLHATQKAQRVHPPAP
mmetsp:Transcript_52657/g.170040  ORF Transcript_52657/g.170040 Transcript_52657/m.170040 type:complete len:270 (-) Transcript_52657:330-1139(-)